MCVSDCRGYAPSLVTFAEAPGGGGGEDLRHALLDGTVADDIDNVTNLVLAKVGGQSDHALLLEIAREGCVAKSAWIVPFPLPGAIIPSATVLPVLPPPMTMCILLLSFRQRGVRLTIASALPKTGGVTHFGLCVLAV
jgi:hypothetical protein